MNFLDDLELRPLNITGLDPVLKPIGLALGRGAGALEVAVVECATRPAATTVRATWRARWNNRPAPVVLVALSPEGASICGPSSEEPIFLPIAVAERICRDGIGLDDPHSARHFLTSSFRAYEGPIPGIRNEGLLATHNLIESVPRRPDWQIALVRSSAVTQLRAEPLLKALGFEVEQQHGQTSVILRHQDARIALAVLVSRGINVDAPDPRFSGLSPVSHGLAVADRERLPYVLVVEGPTVRLYSVDPTIGAGRRGRTETFLEARLDLLDGKNAGYLWMLFSAEALRSGGTAEQILRESGDFAASLGERLRERVYQYVIPTLAAGVARARKLRHPDVQDLKETYEIALTLLFRLLFIAYAEDRRLLPYESNEQYRRRALKTKARELAQSKGPPKWDDQLTLWRELESLFDAVDRGKPAWGVPAYNGGLFSSDPEDSPIGARIRKLELPDDVVGPVLLGLLVDETPDGVLGPVDFRALGVREFGTIYEGLLESDLAVAEADLTVDKDGHYAPVRKKTEKIVVHQGAVYLHDRSGARKSSGTYFTRPFVVDHLLDEALEPALRDHVARLATLDDNSAGEQFFDFRVVDLAMGSGHFLVAAIDRIERALSGYLDTRPLPAVADELARLRKAAEDAAKDVGVAVEVEDGQLLRRQIARRCVYGVDLNIMAVELARLSIWIHTFVPGLPLSFLKHGLVEGNSLVGVATLDEAMEALGGHELFGAGIRDMLSGARADLKKLGRLADADRAEIQQARKAHEAAKERVEPLRKVFDYVVAVRLDPELRALFAHSTAADTFEAIMATSLQSRVTKLLKPVPPFHFPIVFPEVFLRERSGFDVVLGNPPWEEVTIERDRFWGRFIPGLQGMKQNEREKVLGKLERAREDLAKEFEQEQERTDLLRRVLLSSGYPGMGTGDPDLYKGFIWRFWNLLADRGRIGVVLPRSVFQAKGSSDFRKQLLAAGEVADITFLLNTGEWVFEGVEPRYTIALSSLQKITPAGDRVALRGPYTSLGRFMARRREDAAVFQKSELLGWTDTAAFPMLPTERSAAVFAQLRKAPRLDLNVAEKWRARPYAEFHATNDKYVDGEGFIDVMSAAAPRGFWPVFKGESFDIWSPDTGSYYGYANPKVALPELERRRAEGLGRSNSPFYELRALGRLARGTETLACRFPRIAFRDISRSTDTRTLRAALVPGEVFLTNKAPYLLWPRGDAKDQAFLLGILCSRPLDWYARRFVEINLNYQIFNPLPVPRPDRANLLWKRVVEISGRLACPDARFEEFAGAVGVRHGALAPEEKTELVHELDAVVAHLYGLDDVQTRHLVETFHEGWDFESDLAATLRHFVAWRSRT